MLIFYPHKGILTNSQKEINKKRTFVILKTRFRILLNKRLDSHFENISYTILAYCLLHIFCKEDNDHYVDDDGLLDTLLQKEAE